MSILNEEGDYYYFTCPSCDSLIQVYKNEVNCAIFRHGYFFSQINNLIIPTTQIPPHSSFEDCERFKKENKLLGCGKPFRINLNNKTVEKCDYI